VGPRAVLDAVVKKKIPSSRRESNPRTPIVQLVAQRYIDWAITALPPHYVVLFIRMLRHLYFRSKYFPRYGVLRFASRQGLGIFFSTAASRTALGPTQPPIQWAPGALSLGVKRPGREADHSPPSSAEVKNAWSYTSIPHYVFMSWCLVKHRDNFTFTLSLEHSVFFRWVEGPSFAPVQLI
jgi:hypothetical protein